MGRGFRRLCSPPATKSSPAKPFFLSVSCLTTSCQQLPPSPTKQSPQKSLPRRCPRPSLRDRCPRRHVQRWPPLPRPFRDEATHVPNNPRRFPLVQPRVRGDRLRRPRSQNQGYPALVRSASRP